jgi:Ser-tRNA(Ala) deacylase AlaX
MEFSNTTEKIYLKNTYLFKCIGEEVLKVAVIAEEAVERKFGSCCIVLTGTIFHAQGGGQPSDKGFLSLSTESEQKTPIPIFDVIMVKEMNGVVFHYGNPVKVDQEGSESIVDLQTLLIPGTKVNQYIDEDFRLECARLHSAGHLIDVCMQRLGLLDTLKATKGYHFSDGPYVEFQGVITEELASLPSKMNEIITELVGSDVATEVEVMSREDAAVKCNYDTTNSPGSGDLRVVSIAGMPCPCGGTHVESTKNLQGLEVTKVKKKKDIYKVSYKF